MTPSFFTDDVKAAIAAHADEFPAEEVCGLVLKDHTVVRSENKIEGSDLTEDGKELDKTTGAVIDHELIDEHEDNIACVYHSHWSDLVPGYLSFTDIDQSRWHGVPYLLYHTEFKVWDYYDPDYYHPYPLREKNTSKKKIAYYLNWPWEYGRSDCAAITRAYFKNILDHDIFDYARPQNGQWYHDPNLETSYLDLMNDPANGFVQINTSHPKKNDLVLLRFFGSRQPCHVGIMTSETTMLHLLQPGHLSEEVVWGGAWQRCLHSVWRLAK